MSVNDGLSDEEWGAWGKPANGVADNNLNGHKDSSKLQNGFGSDNEVIINGDNTTSEPTSRFNVSNNKDNSMSSLNGRSFEKRGGFSGSRGTNRFATRKVEESDDRNENNDRNYNRNSNRNNYNNSDNRNNYNNSDRENKFGYQDNKNNWEIKKMTESEQNCYKNERSYEREKSPSERNDRYCNKMNGYKRDEGKDKKNYRDNSLEYQKHRDNSGDYKKNRDNSRERKNRRDDSVDYKKRRNDSLEYKKCRDDSLDYQKRRNGSRERKSRRDDSLDYKKRRDDSLDYKKRRDDSLDYKKRRDDTLDYKKRRDDSLDYKKRRGGSRERKSRRDDSLDYKRTRDDSRDRKNIRNDSRNRNKHRDDSRDNRKPFNRRDDSNDSSDRNRRSNRRNREDSRENRKKPEQTDCFKRDDSRDKNRIRDKKSEFSKRDESWEERREEFNREQRINSNSRDYFKEQNDEKKKFEPKKFHGENDDFSHEFERTVTLDERNQKTNSNRNQDFDQINNKNTEQNDNEPIPIKRATFIPDDNQEDYELHVNSGINFDNYDKIPVEVTGDDAPQSLTSFTHLNLPEFLIKNIESLKYSKLTPVQKYAIPIIDNKRDLMACAQTGSGKTAAFLIPIIKSLHDNEANGTSGTTSASSVAFPKALIMAPTRELCRQIFTAARQLCRGSNIKCAYIYGGIEMNKSRRNIQATGGCDILVATPGRLIHFLELVWLSLRYLQYFVLDEADRMLDSDGFYESVQKIYNEANCSGEDRSIQISMFSATFPNEIQNLARNLLKNYLFLAVGVVGSANSDVKQEIIQSDQREKVNTAIEYIKTIPDEKTLIFVESKRMADFLGIKLGYLGFKATTIHGDREQEQREIALNDFKSGRVNFMVATNVAARGLDIPKVDNVINIDMPDTIDTYVHRIGRTGRCGNVGRAISFFDEMKDIGLAQGLVSKLQEANQECPDWLKALCDGPCASRAPNYYSRDTRKNVKSSKYIDNPTNNDDGFMKGTNIDYDDVKPTSEWLED